MLGKDEVDETKSTGAVEPEAFPRQISGPLTVIGFRGV